MGIDMSGGASSSGASNPVGLDVSNITEIDVDKFPVLEALPCIKKGRVGTPRRVNLARVRLPSGEAVLSCASNIHFMEEKLQPFVDFALGADASETDRFRFRDTGFQVAGSHQDAPPTNCCVTGCRETTRLALLANLKSFRQLEDEWVILARGIAPPQHPCLSHPCPSHPQSRGRGSSRKFGKQLNTGTQLSGRLSGQYTRGREMLQLDHRVEQARGGDSWNQSVRGWTL